MVSAEVFGGPLDGAVVDVPAWLAVVVFLDEEDRSPVWTDTDVESPSASRPARHVHDHRVLGDGLHQLIYRRTDDS